MNATTIPTPYMGYGVNTPNMSAGLSSVPAAPRRSLYAVTQDNAVKAHQLFDALMNIKERLHGDCRPKDDAAQLMVSGHLPMANDANDCLSGCMELVNAIFDALGA